MKFKLTWHLVGQVLAIIVQYGNLALNVGHLGTTAQLAVTAAVGIAQVLLHVYAHNLPAPTN